MLTKKRTICTKTPSRVSVCCVSRGHSVNTSCAAADGSQASGVTRCLAALDFLGGDLKAEQGDPHGRQKAPQPLSVSEPFSALGRLRLKGLSDVKRNSRGVTTGLVVPGGLLMNCTGVFCGYPISI